MSDYNDIIGDPDSWNEEDYDFDKEVDKVQDAVEAAEEAEEERQRAESGDGDSDDG